MTPAQVREQVRAYQARTGLSTGQVGLLAGVAYQTMSQFMACYKPYDDDKVAASLAGQILKGLEENQPQVPDVEGALYSTGNVRILDQQLDAAREGEHSLIYGSPGTQKSFVFQRRVAEALRRAGLEAPSIGYVYASAAMTTRSLAQEVARQFVAYASGNAYQVLTNIVFALRRRRRRNVLIVDEAQHLDGADKRPLAMLEILRELVDRAPVGLIVAGHDRLEQIFDPDRSPLEQFCQRFDHRLRLPGLSEKEVHEIAKSELGPLSERAMAGILKESEAKDRHTRSSYYSARYLFKVVEQVCRARAKNGSHSKRIN